MSLFPIIEVAIGLMLMYLLLSFICTAITELIASVVRLRARTLKRGIQNLLGDEQRVRAFFAHPAIRALTSSTAVNLPVVNAAPEDCSSSYVPAPLFARVLMTLLDPSLVAPPAAGTLKPTIDTFRTRVETTAAAGGPPDLHQAIAVLIWDAADIAVAQERIEGWFDETMDRVSGWYKRWVQLISFCVGLAIAVAMNVDTIRVAQRLWIDPVLRGAVYAAAQKQVADSAVAGADTDKSPTPQQQAAGAGGAPASNAPAANVPAANAPAGNAPAGNRPANGGAAGDRGTSQQPPSTKSPSHLLTQAVEAQRQLDKLKLPIGWQRPFDASQVPTAIPGWLITAAALTLGAPFWFDLLKRFVNIRSAGDAPGDKPAGSAKK